ncbi:MAG TPA: DUF2339 domain-containing protein [Opitutaceae bacterium]|nr:DUF2339 domain-containing protein [Opitutaceae bacterium]HOR25528.1 DUF2339 domain-containing protein [Opitutaceae bacterium]HPK49667.1 DUF2339 domain-containing protein [Opitutaceae bacterium]
MIELLVVLILALLAWLVVWSFVSVFLVRGLRHRVDELSEQVEDLRATRGLGKLPAPVAVESRTEVSSVPPPCPLVAESLRLAAAPEPVVDVPPPPVVVTRPAEPPPVMASSNPAAVPPPLPVDFAPVPPKVVPPVVPAAPVVAARQPEREAAPAINWEMFMGVKLFAWLGGLALFLGVALGVKYSFENNLIPPEVRVACGFLIGAGLLVGGVWLARKAYAVTSQTLCATGVVILYAVTFSCRSIYHFEFFTTWPTLVLMVLITTTAFLLAIRLEAQLVAILGILGGFLTPILLSTGVDNPPGLFGYIALLDVGLIAVALNRRWLYLVLLGAAGTVAMQIGWAEKFFTVHKVGTALTVLVAFQALFLLAYGWARRRQADTAWLAGATGLLAAVAFGFAFVWIGNTGLGFAPGWIFAAALSADLCLLTLAALENRWAKLHLGAGLVAFLLLAIWMGNYIDRSDALLPWALGATLGFAILHTVFPLVLQRVRPASAPVWWGHFFPPVALALVLYPIVQIPEVSFLVWPVVLLIDVLAIVLAVLTGSLIALAAVLVLTLVATACWLFQIPTDGAMDLSLAPVALIGGFSLLFFAVGAWAVRRWLRKIETNGAEAANAEFGTSAQWMSHLPVMSAVLPFLLLIMVTLRLPQANLSPIFGLALVLVVLLLGLARQLGNGLLPLVALGCVAALEAVAPETYRSGMSEGQAGVLLAWFVGFYALFTAQAFVLRRAFVGQLAPWVASALAGPVHFWLIYRLVIRHWPNEVMGLIPMVFAVPALLSLVLTLRLLAADAPRRLAILAWWGGVALFFVTLIFPVQFDRQWITIGWALEGAALLWLYHRIPHGGLRLVGLGLLCAAFARLALNPAVFDYHFRSETPIWNWYLYSYGLTTLCLLAGARLLAPPRDRALGLPAPAILQTLAGVLAFLLLNIEIADYFSEAGSTLTFQFSGNFARDMAYTIGWALYAFGILMIGLWKRVRPTRWAAIGLLSVTLAKLFFHDLSQLGQLYRIGALVVVAVIAILASFLYQRFLAMLAKEESPATPAEKKE